MIDHISLGVRDLAAGGAFYEVVLAPLGYHLLVERDETVGFGKRYPEIWLNHRPGQRPVPADTGHHVCLRARSIDEVDRFHAAALGAGGRDAGGPGPRQGAQVTYYGAFVLDLDGNKLEAMTVPPAAD